MKEQQQKMHKINQEGAPFTLFSAQSKFGPACIHILYITDKVFFSSNKKCHLIVPPVGGSRTFLR